MRKITLTLLAFVVTFGMWQMNAQVFVGSGNPQPIPASGTGGAGCLGGPTTSDADASSLSGVIGTDYEIDNVTIDLTHTWDSDLEIDLISPDGTVWDLSSGNGGSGDDYTNTIFMDGNPSITTGSPPFTGTFEAEQGPFATGFDGDNVSGNWRLSICDFAGGDSGTLLSYTITFNSLIAAPINVCGTGNPQPIPASGTGGAGCAGGPSISDANVPDTGIIGTDYTLDNVMINLTHTWDSDMDIDLISPTGTVWDLSSGNGGSGDNYTNTIFMDGNPSITTGSAPFTGTFEAEQGAFATAFAGESITGDWTLSICDNAGGDSGTLLSYCITFEPITAVPVCTDLGVADTNLNISCGAGNMYVCSGENLEVFFDLGGVAITSGTIDLSFGVNCGGGGPRNYFFLLYHSNKKIVINKE